MSTTWAGLQNQNDNSGKSNAYHAPFTYSAHVASASLEVRMGFLRKVYGIVASQLAMTALVATLAVLSPTLATFMQTSRLLLNLAAFGSLASLLTLFAFRKSSPTNFILLGVFTFFESYLVATIVTFYEVESVLQAFILTASIVVGLTLYTFQTKKDFTFLLTTLVVTLWGMIGVGIVRLFLPPSETFNLVYAMFGAFVFSLFIIVDTQIIMRKATVDDYIMCAIDLYLDIINLFIKILEIVGKQK